ncbi:hypothetical protein [Sphingobacterium sp. CZ-2]|uniref:hypothetical protein n=1 Tax=Sphingobacterium sp. CZ-2 TaxID=2557994 RepID=UPI0014302279|nr:hypothetical protein [Sphingobacterium sp. CZ-2]
MKTRLDASPKIGRVTLLSSFQWIEFENNSFDSILQALTIQQNKYLDYQQKQVNKHRTFETKEVSDEFLYKKKV